MPDSTHSIWVDPLAFDMQEHGAPYLPEQRTKTASGGNVLSKLTAFLGDLPMAELGALVAVLRAATMMHQTHHWQTSGPTFYGDHLLFERIYNETVGFVDTIAERSVGAGSKDLVCPKHQAAMVQGLIRYWEQGTSGTPLTTELVRTSLLIIQCVLDCIATARILLDSKDQLSDGTDNLLQGVADKHEEFLYLLQQRLEDVRTASYDRRKG